MFKSYRTLESVLSLRTSQITAAQIVAITALTSNTEPENKKAAVDHMCMPVTQRNTNVLDKKINAKCRSPQLMLLPGTLKEPFA